MKSVLVASVFVAVLTLIGRLLGFGRDLLLAASFGPTEIADSAVLLLTLPDLLVTLLLTGGFGAALVPALKRAPAEARVALTQRVGLLTVLAFALLAGLLSLAPQAPVSLLAPALDVAQIPGFGHAFLLSTSSLPLVALAGVVGAYLNAKGVFGVPNVGVIVYNLFLCLYLGLIASGGNGVFGLAVAILAAALMRLSIHIAAARELLRPRRSQLHDGGGIDGDIAHRFAIGVVTSSLVLAAPVIFRALFSADGDGLLMLFNLAQKMFELPSGILIAPLVLVMLPKLSAMAAAGKSEKAAFERSFTNALVAAVSIATSAAMAAIVFSGPLSALLFGHGMMTQTDVDRVAGLAVIFLAGLPFLAAQQITAAALNAQGKPKTVAMAAVLALGIALVMALGIDAVVSLMAGPVPEALCGPVIGLLLFQIILAALTLIALPEARQRFGNLARAFGVSLLRSGLTILPFFGLMAVWGDDFGPWTGSALGGLAFIAMLGANISDLRPVLRMRSGTT